MSQPPPARKRIGDALGIAFAYVVLWPLTRILGLFGLWPRLSAIVINKTMNKGLRGYTPGPRDVLVCSYFKTGTNWAMYIAVQIAHRGKAAFEHIHDIVPWPEMPSSGRFVVGASDYDAWHQAPTGLGVVKTHLPMSRLPYVPEAKYLYVVRDPKDVFVSSYHFVRSVAFGFLMPPVEDWLDTYLSPDTPLGSWAVHLDDGWRVRDRPNVLFLTYERMKADTEGTVRAIAALMGVDLTAAEIADITRLVGIDAMKRIGSRFDIPGPPWASSGGAMVRKGQSKSAGELITLAQQQRIDRYWRAELDRLGCDFPYAEEFHVAGAAEPGDERRNDRHG